MTLKSNFKKIASIILVIACLVSFVACGSNSATNTSDSSTVAGTTSAGSSNTTISGEKTVISMWGWETYEQQKEEFDKFSELNPNLKVEMTIIKQSDMPVRVQTALASGTQMPDIAWLEMSVRGKLLSLDCWDDLTKTPYNIDTSLLVPSMLPLATNEKGEFVGLDDGPSMAGIAFKRDLAKQYLGSDDPVEVQKMFPTWDAFIQKGKEVKEKSGGKIFMLPSLGDILVMARGQNNIPYAVGDTLNLKESLGPAFQLCIDMKTAGIVDTIAMDSPAYNASIAEKNHMFLPAPYWGPRWIIDLNDPDNKNMWGLMVPPGGGYPYGGTSWSIPKTALHKEEAIKLLKWLYLTEEGGAIRRDSYGYTIPLKSLYEADSKFYTGSNPHFAGQDTLNYFTSVIAKSVAPSRQVYKYDSEIDNSTSLAITALAASKKAMTADELVKIVEDDVIQKVPTLKVK
ncbi:MAG TPA: extracellular solute-binding protein [Ruminiclostridium sp.]